MKNFNEYFANENLGRNDINELNDIVSQLPEMRWNISEESGYFGDEWDNWEHMEEDERAEYFGQMFGTIKKLKDKIESLYRQFN